MRLVRRVDMKVNEGSLVGISERFPEVLTSNLTNKRIVRIVGHDTHIH